MGRVSETQEPLCLFGAYILTTLIDFRCATFPCLPSLQQKLTWSSLLLLYPSKRGSNLSDPVMYMKHAWLHGLVEPVHSKPRRRHPLPPYTPLRTISHFFSHIQMSNGDSKVEPRRYWTILSPLLRSVLCDWINYVSLTSLEVSKHTFAVISHQSMWPWRWKVKHVSQEAGQRGIRPLISGPTQSHYSTLPWELKLSLWAMYSEL